MHRLTCCIVLLLIPLLCTGQASMVWVLGSFSDPLNAEKESVRLSALLGKSVTVIQSKHQHYRVVTSADTTNKAELGNIEAWLSPVHGPLISISPAEITIEPGDPGSVSVIAIDDPPITIKEPPPEPLYPAFNPGEALYQYCERLPASRLCLHPRIRNLFDTDRKLEEHRQKLSGACELVTDPQWRQTCLSL